MSSRTALEPLAFLTELVRIPSYSGCEREAVEFAVDQMTALGYRKAYRDSWGNAVGHWGPESERKILLVGHIDTVRGEIPVRLEPGPQGDVLFGRGSVDAKGPLATFIQAVATLPKDSSVEVVVVGAVEEEAPTSKGARGLLADFSEPLCVIIGEPSQTDGATLGYKGRLLLELTIKREMSHSAHSTLSAGDLGCALHQAIRSDVESQNEGLSGIFPILDYTLQGFNTASDGFEEHASLSLGFRLGPSFCPHALAERMEALVAAFAAQHESLTSYDVSVVMKEIPAQFDKRGLLPRLFRAAIRGHGGEPRLFLKTGTADMNVLAAGWPSCPMVAYGPGDSALDHTPNEHLPVADYQRAQNILRSALEALLGKVDELR